MTFLLLILFIKIDAAPVIQTCVSYEPDAVSLTGTIKRHTFAGPPNYESVAKGDQPERIWVLHLTRPICVSASGDREEEQNVSDLELVFPGAQNDYRRYRSLLNRRVSVKGKLFHQHTGHHHKNVLLTVDRISKR